MALSFTKEEVKLYLTGHLRMATRSSTGESYLKPSTPKGNSSNAKRMQHRLWYLKNVVKRRAYTRAWRLKNPITSTPSTEALRLAAIEARAGLPKARIGRPPKVSKDISSLTYRRTSRKLLTLAQKKAIKAEQNARYHRENRAKIAARSRARYLAMHPGAKSYAPIAPRHVRKPAKPARLVTSTETPVKRSWLSRLIGW
jgi:hypothetical protein